MSVLEHDELSPSQEKTLRALQKFIDENGYPPTVDELASRLRLTKASVHGSLDKLIQKGYLKRAPGKARSIEILRTPQASVIDVVGVPILGDVPAGTPISPQESHAGQIYIESSIVGNDVCFALSVIGDSMRDAEIRDGDVLIVRKQQLAEHHDIVVASVDGEVTVKRLSIKEGRVRLLPENREFKPIEIGPDVELRILGRVIATRRVVKRC
ncbi:MAG: transcriptional repressor LexA [Planctomycetaceae bacterium]